MEFMNRIFFLILVSAGLYSCSPLKVTSKYYYEHEKELDRIEESYKALYAAKPFTIAFTDKEFSTVAMEIITDSLSYIYEFRADEQRFRDTLAKYQLQTDKIIQLVNSMQKVRCAWVNNFDYYVNDRQQRLIFISVKPVAVRYPFTPAKYYILAYFFQPQVFDKDGNLLNSRRQRKLRKLNGATFMRINDKVCYTVSERFR